jgi:glycosyltransferase involved in cell wall biosynthesis
MLKDIFPQNALDINILKKTGLSGVIYYYFRHREKQLYKNADYIGCMSTANEIYLQQHNSYLKRSDIGFCPNTINVLCEYECDKNKLRQKFQLPLDKTIFIYGGNFGKPQDVDYIIKILKSNEDRNDCHFIMCGSGTDFYKIKNYADGKLNHNLTVINNLDKTEYSLLLDACDVGLIFLDHRFTIPNFPSRLLDYMNHCLPVLSATDENTDVGNVILKGGFGWWCKSDSLEKFNDLLDEIIAKKANLNYMGMLGKKYLENHYNTNIAYTQIVNAYEVFRGK